MTLVVTVLTIWSLAAVALCWSAHRARTAATPTPPPDPDPRTAEFPLGSDDDDTVLAPWKPPVPPSNRRPESPLYLEGYQLDAAFYAVLAPSFREYH